MDGSNFSAVQALKTIKWHDPYKNEESIAHVNRIKAVHLSHPRQLKYYYARSEDIAEALKIAFTPDNPIPARDALEKELETYDIMFANLDDAERTPIMYVSCDALHKHGISLDEYQQVGIDLN